ncbi:ER membrane glycoprotein subunit of the GPI transamidase complex-like protein [Kalmusia sp. IMI 367209]|nr:ER membrane glycoprotein subunit of the GPI transamidase complex-like protein [Kalmusia sp. IMI 367209]
MQPRNLSKRLILVFVAWKVLLFAVAALSPGPGYDTSAFIASSPTSLRHTEFKSWSRLDRLSLNLFRWDALYFVKSAQRGYLYEQEWAFSWAYSLLIKTVVKLITGNTHHPLKIYVWTAILISNSCHLASALFLYRLLNVLLGHQQNARLPFIASVLHIVSPAGVFLSSAYAESLFAALNFLGMLQYTQARVPDRPYKRQTIREDALILSAGVLFLLATWVRSNGLLSGLLFVFDVIGCVPSLMKMQLSRNDIRRLAITCISGALLGLGSLLPQYVAFREYCTAESSSGARPWCYKTIPSIYTWVQSNYWDVGFLRYWTASNLPLFVIAAPMLWLLLRSGIDHLRNPAHFSVKPRHIQPDGADRDTKDLNTTSGNLPQLALPQLVLAITAISNFHVQVINRLSSGYPIWYLAVARWLIAHDTAQRKEQEHRAAQWVCRGLVVYAIVQGALFANFLPPA